MTEVKQGTLKYYHRGLFNKKWKPYKFILYDSSLLTWYSDPKRKKPDGMVLLKDVEEYICVGPYTKILPDYPNLENIYDEVALIAFPMSAKDRDRDIVWLLCDDLDDLNSWMKAIVETLPSKRLQMEKPIDASAPLAEDENVETITEIILPEDERLEPIIIKAESIVVPLSAAVVGAHLQANVMNSKSKVLEKVGYDYGSDEWGAGEGWGYSSSSVVPGFAGIGGGGAYSNHIDLAPPDEDEQQQPEEPNSEIATNDEAVEQATYELSKNTLEDFDEIPNYPINALDPTTID